MSDSADSAELATIARETFEYNVIPWAGRKYEPWMRAWARQHPGDPGLVQLPSTIYRAFQSHTLGQRLSRQQAEALGYPRVPGEQELAQVRRELHDALMRSDWARHHELEAQLRKLQEDVAKARMSASGSRPDFGI